MLGLRLSYFDSCGANTVMDLPLSLITKDPYQFSNPLFLQGEVNTIVAALRKTHLDSGRQSSRTPATSPPSSAASDSTPRTPPSSGRVGAGSHLAPSPSRHALSVLILSAVYARDVLKELIDRGVTDEEAFCWLAQLRSVRVGFQVTVSAEGMDAVRNRIPINGFSLFRSCAYVSFHKLF